MSEVATTKMSSRGQVVIPEEVRERLGLEQGAQFVVVGEGDTVVLKAIRPPTMKDFERLIGDARKAAKRAGLQKSDIERAIREVRAGK
jgi:AbrB family looped-hinge helix DNA binding protein